MFKSTGTLRLLLQTWGERANGMKVYMSRLLGSVSDEIKKRIKLNASQVVRVKQNTNFGISCFFFFFKPQRGIYTNAFFKFNDNDSDDNKKKHLWTLGRPHGNGVRDSVWIVSDQSSRCGRLITCTIEAVLLLVKVSD